MRSLLTLLAASALLFSLVGCASSHKLEGKVVTGNRPMIEVVSSDDSRLRQPGVAGAQVEAIIDPDTTARPNRVGPTMSDEHGEFTLDIEEFGAGFLEYDMGILTRARGHRDHYEVLPMPRSGHKLLIVIAPGSPSRQPSGPPRDTLEPGEREMLEGNFP